MGNMDIYERLRNCPPEALKEIKGGRLKGMSDINPMWRIKMLTDTFGVCGFGWTTKIVRTWIDDGKDGEKTANVEIELRVKMNDEWSEPIPGIGGAQLVAQERAGLYTDDECYKKAYTDAISVACKALGMAANVYYNRDRDSKYETIPATEPPTQNPPQQAQATPPKPDIQAVKCNECGKLVGPELTQRTITAFGVPLCKECGTRRALQKIDTDSRTEANNG